MYKLKKKIEYDTDAMVMHASRTTCDRKFLTETWRPMSNSRSCWCKSETSRAPQTSTERMCFSWHHPKIPVYTCV